MPILYTFRRCPYAMRARMALAYAGIAYEVREVVLRDKPQSMLDLSPKGTVPVLKINDRVIDESIEIVDWALQQTDSQGWRDYPKDTLVLMQELIDCCETDFKPALDGYKYTREPDTALTHRNQACRFLAILEQQLAQHAHARDTYLVGDRVSYADIAIFPFVRQFAHVDINWFNTTAFPLLQRWLAVLKASELFLDIMHKYQQWRPESEPITFVPRHSART